MNLDKIRKLLALARAQPDAPEGISARKMATKHLEKLGLSEADVSMKEQVLLFRGRKDWEGALADVITTVHPVELRQRVNKEDGTDVLFMRGTGADVDLVHYRFDTIRRAVLKYAGEYFRSVRALIPVSTAMEMMQIFCNYMVIAIAERILIEDIEDQELDELEADLDGIDLPDDDPEPSPVSPDDLESDDLLDKLMDSLNEDVGHGLGRLEPALAGYQAGMHVPLTDAIPAEARETTTEAARRLVHRRGMLNG